MDIRTALAIGVALTVGACSSELPADLEGYAERCIRLNGSEIPPHDDDVHEGYKIVYACEVELSDLVDEAGAPRTPYPDGIVFVKESRREHQDFPWLVATARKVDGGWEWEEFTRNFESEPLLSIPVPESVCRDCHAKVAAIDFIYTTYQPPPEPPIIAPGAVD